jgi:hypothetical protein
MAELIPELRTDRNGKLVTRHVKAASSTKASMSQVPRVDVSASDLWELRKELAKQLDISVLALDGSLRQPHRLNALIGLASRHDLAISSHNSLIESLTEMPSDQDFMRCVELLDRHFDAARKILDGRSRNAAVYANGIVTGLNLLEFDMTQEQELLVVEAGCRIWVGEIVKDHGFKTLNEVFPKRSEEENRRCVGPTAMRADLAHYLIGNPEKVDLVVEVVVKRGISDPRLLDGLVDEFSTAAVPLTEGVL